MRPINRMTIWSTKSNKDEQFNHNDFLSFSNSCNRWTTIQLKQALQVQISLQCNSNKEDIFMDPKKFFKI